MTFSDAEPSQDFIVPDSEIYVPLKECVQGLCSICDELICQLCAHCMSSATYFFLKQTFLEHFNRRNMKMLAINYDTEAPYTKEDHLLHIWRQSKCEEDVTWC
ncbi:hypothetical protein GCK32_020032 [Trichostrongylus colubriformis]|uniref:Uncharacterized protein n=1 Tax=Trichostrongylus colubriformis TaxID=6319 RepID=A0AAN8EPS6_TRICO